MFDALRLPLREYFPSQIPAMLFVGQKRQNQLPLLFEIDDWLAEIASSTSL
jgi:hypothetical protein